MPRDVQLLIRPPDGATPASVTGTLSDEDLATLAAYIGYVDALDALSLVKSGFQFGISFNIEGGRTSFIPRHPDPEAVLAVLHRLRPLVLSREHASFERVSGILGRTFSDPSFRAVLKVIRITYDSTEQDLPRIISNDVVLSSRATLFDWLNSYGEYHTDQEKKAKLDKLLGHVPDALSQHAFLMAIDGLVKGAQGLAGLVELVLGRQDSFDAYDTLLEPQRGPDR